MDDKERRIARARELLQTVKHATMATVNEDGSPHNSPFLFLHHDRLTKIYWGSHPKSEHSKNILRTGQLFVVIYDAFQRGGLYIKAENGHPVEGEELDEALQVHNRFRAKEDKTPIEKSYYEDKSPQKMWAADVVGLWVNGAERNEQGQILRDFRRKVTAKELLEP